MILAYTKVVKRKTMKDCFGREISYLRISVTDRCNLRCKYCMPECGIENIGHENILTFEDIERIVKASTELGIKKFRITGGEPLARRGIVDLIGNLAKIKGVEELAMTTNGTMLSEHAEALKNAGLNRVNISLDTLDHMKYAEITRGGDLDQVFMGIDAAIKADLMPVKLNIVAIAGFNDDEILDFVQLTYNHPIDIRFIELMPIGTAKLDEGYRFMSSEEIKRKLPSLITLKKDGGVADNYIYPEAIGKIGFISPMSNLFCGICNKIRLTSDGKLKPCLHSNQEIDLNEVLKKGDDNLVKEFIKTAISNKEEKHHLNEGVHQISRDMNKIGG